MVLGIEWVGPNFGWGHKADRSECGDCDGSLGERKKTAYKRNILSPGSLFL